jgi:hypothetical protein
MAKVGIREEFKCRPTPRYGDGPKIYYNSDGSLTCSHDVPRKRVITMANDQAPDDHMRDIAVELSEILQGLSPSDRARAESLIIKLIERDAGANTDDPVPSAMDEPPHFPGKPYPPGVITPGIPRAKLAGDKKGWSLKEHEAWEQRFHDMFPGARIPRVL